MMRKLPDLSNTASTKAALRRARAQINVMSLPIYGHLPLETRVANVEGLAHNLFHTILELGLYNDVLYQRYRTQLITARRLRAELKRHTKRKKKG